MFHHSFMDNYYPVNYIAKTVMLPIKSQLALLGNAPW